jgi:hypothetical protein
MDGSTVINGAHGITGVRLQHDRHNKTKVDPADMQCLPR